VRWPCTHYYTWHEQPDEAALEACVADMRRIIDARRYILAGPLGGGEPVVGPRQVALNGVGEDAHETFAFPGDMGFNFCKTQWKPYDDVVVACLLVARDYFPEEVLEIASDGQGEPGAFRAGQELYTTVLEREPAALFAEHSSNGPEVARRLGRIAGPAILAVIALLVWLYTRRNGPVWGY